jgi:hypothetical protein
MDGQRFKAHLHSHRHHPHGQPQLVAAGQQGTLQGAAALALLQPAGGEAIKYSSTRIFACCCCWSCCKKWHARHWCRTCCRL